jgi:hypothetical protein
MAMNGNGFWSTLESKIIPFGKGAPKSDSQRKKTSPPNAKEPMQQLMIAIGKVFIPILLNPKMEDIQRFLPGDVVKNVYSDDQQRASKWRAAIKKVQDAKNHVLKLRAEELEQTIKRSNSWPSPADSEKRQVEVLKTAYILDRLRILLGGLTSVIDVDQTFDLRISDHEKLRQWLASFCGVVMHNRFEPESLRTQDKQAGTRAFWQARAPSGKWTPIAKRTLENFKRHGGKAPDILEVAIQFEFGLPIKEKAASKREQTVFDRSRYDERISEGSSFDLILTRASDALYS